MPIQPHELPEHAMNPWWMTLIIPVSINLGLGVGFVLGVLWAEARSLTEMEQDE